MYRIAIVATLAALAGCSTSPVAFDSAHKVPSERVLAYGQKPPGAHGTIQVTRDTGFVAGGCFLAVHIDGKPAARIDTGEAVSLYVPVGDHLVGLGGDEKGSGMCSWAGSLKEQAATLKAGQVKRYRIGGDTSAGLDIRPTSM